MARLITCPRCDGGKGSKIASSPIKGKWEVYRCPKCNYLWRSTENLKGIAKLTSKMVDEAVPTVP